MRMPENNDDEIYARICQEDLEFSGPPGPGERHISYRLTPAERTGGLDVRFLVKVVSGNHAKALNAIQAKAIMDLLRWCRDYRQQQEQTHRDQAAPPGRPARTQAARLLNTRGNDTADAGKRP
jgi:hypothetical protein